MNRTALISRLQSSRHLLDAYEIRKISIFGSVAWGDEKEAGGVELLVEFEDNARVGIFRFSKLRRELSELLGCDVDLATPDALHKKIRKAILAEAIYAA